MGYILKLVLLLIIMLSQPYVITPDQQNAIPINYFTPELMTPIFKEMRSYGEGKRNAINQQNKKENKKIKKENDKIKKENKKNKDPKYKKALQQRKVIYKQYLCITIMSDEEIEEVKATEKLPNEFEAHNIFLLNKFDHGEEYYNPDRQLHGEVIATHFGEIERLIKDFKQSPKTKDKYPIMLLYSHYIPCANVNDLGYSCSEELMNYAIGRKAQFIMLVAYTEYFNGTDVEESKKFMTRGGIIAFEQMKDQYVHELEVYVPNSIDGITKTFQGEAYDCILQSPLSNCCIGDKNNKHAIISYFINYVTYQCISKSNAARFFTQLSKNQLITCLSKVIHENIGDDCIQCSTKNRASTEATKSLFLKCFADSVKCSKGMGIPSKSIYNPEWLLCENCNWKYIYNYPGPKRIKKMLPKVMCANRSNSIESMCTLYEKFKKSKYNSYDKRYPNSIKKWNE